MMNAQPSTMSTPTTEPLLTIRMSTCSANEVLSSLEKGSDKCDCTPLFDLVLQGLNLLHVGKGGKVRTENTYAYFDADFLDSKVYVNIRLKQEHWTMTECLRQVHVKLQEMGYTKEKRIENVLFDNRMHIFIPYKKPGFQVKNPSG